MVFIGYNTGRKRSWHLCFDKSKIYERAIKINELFEINLDKISIDDYKDQVVSNNLISIIYNFRLVKFFVKEIGIFR